MTDKENKEQQAVQPEETPTGEAAVEEKRPFDPDTATRDEWKAYLAEKDEAIQAQEDRALRLAAEAENTRKRLERERKDSVTFANESILRELLPVVDNLEAALEHGNAAEAESGGLLEGVRMTYKTLLDMMARFGCKPFESIGEPFDPNYHEAIMQEESDEQSPGAVLKEYRKGYTLHDRLLRAAMVVVCKSPGGSPPNRSGETKGTRVDSKA